VRDGKKPVVIRKTKHQIERERRLALQEEQEQKMSTFANAKAIKGLGLDGQDKFWRN
jgi:hypothetical protein